MRRLLGVWGVFGAVLALALAGCGSGSTGSGSSGSSGASGGAPAAVVEIRNIAFDPPAVQIKRGDTVEWRFDDSPIVHNVIGDGGLNSGDRSTGTYSHRFTRRGTFFYQCSLHASMHAEIDVG